MREEFWDIACEALPLWQFLLVLVVILLAMLGLSVPFVERGTDSYYISLMALSLLLPLLIASVYAIRRCSNRNRSTDRTGAGGSEED